MRITKEFIEKDKVMDYKYRKNMENEKENYKQLLDRLPNMDLDNMNIKFNKKICNLEIKDLKERIKIFDKLKQIFQIPEILYGDGEKLSEEVNHKTNKVLKILDDPKNQKDCKYFSWDFRGKLHQLLCNENLIYKKTNFYKIDEKEIFSLFEKNTKWIGLNKNQYEKLRLKRGFEVLLYEDYLKERIKCFLDSKCFTLKDFLVSCFKPYIEKDQVLFKDKLRSIDEVYVFDFNQAIIGTTVKGSRTAIGFNIHYPESLIRLIAGELNCNEVFSKKIFISFLQQSKILPKTIKVIL
ncbi:MAG: hypothetical protein KAU95_00120 [Candidatus Aenigmarchaeota archaeon]|nr:hypothetical protein [Candidatus Aenigmarchaeota archaeon]